MIYVIGSGPSGIAATSALLEGGHDVTILDYGLELEEEKKEINQKLQRLPPDQWPSKMIDQLKGMMASSRHGVRFKKSYGSDFVFRDATFVENQPRRTDAKPTLAKGGFSNVWGSVVLPFLDHDMTDWPVKQSDFNDHYKAIASLIGLSGVRDGLERLFPFHAPPSEPLKLSSQAKKVLARMEANRKTIEGAGFVFGRPRLAVRSESSPAGPGCVACGLCLYGCPHELIYNTAFALKKFKDNPRFHYRPDVYVERVAENSGGVEITATDIRTKGRISFKGDRVYLGAGVLSSTRILLTSLDAYDAEISIKDSQYFILPFLFREGTRNVQKESLHTLCQLLLELIDDSLTRNTINLQLYTYNDLYSNVVRNMLRPFTALFDPFISVLLGRLMVFQGFLHSNDSSIMKAKLEKSGDTTRLVLDASENSATRPLIRALVKKMNTLSRELGGWVLSPLVTVAVPGEGNHYGSSFPMSRSPGQYQTDLLGRPHGLKKIHVIDASVLPSIPATSVTFTIMANAHRIAAHEPEF